MFDEIAKQQEIDKIKGRLDDNESVKMLVRQSRIKPGSMGGINPSTIFVTEKRVIIRNPTRFGLGEDIEEYFYHQITNIRLEKGMFSAALIFAIPGMTELSKSRGISSLGGPKGHGLIDAIPKDMAEKMYNYIREKISEAKTKKESNSQQTTTNDDPLKILKTRYAKGEITKEEYEEMKEALSD